jgi:hypothetical protein
MRGKDLSVNHSQQEVTILSRFTFGTLHTSIMQRQEFSRYTHSEFVGVVCGIGNSRGEVTHDPSAPSLAAEQLGRDLFQRKYSDYRIDTQRSGRVWASGEPYEH